MSTVHETVCSTLNSILTSDSNIGAPLSSALMALGSAIDHVQKDVEQVRRMSRTNWLLIINMPLPMGMSKSSALQQVMSALEYNKPLFDSDRDLLASEITYVNRAGLLCNMAVSY
ncbi:unnamed protein product [Cylicostephanus goldi]|uniref:Uncharacterized protein n=1 Tax=Cylicostephanus goldi TaxID=71465 RepID=A0A3P6TE46_CYLGO|nr:unnamed protein product [Cylicostephanus goldi]